MKTKLSSGTWLVKGLYPAACLLMLVWPVLALFGVVGFERGRVELILAIAVCLLFNAYSLYFAIKTKDVWVEKGHLIVKGGNRTERVGLVDVARVTGWSFGNHRPVWVTFSTPTAFGWSIVFCSSGFRIFNSGRNAAADDLQRMVARAKARRGAAQRVQPDAAVDGAGEAEANE
jgi:hypothetical protein